MSRIIIIPFIFFAVVGITLVSADSPPPRGPAPSAPGPQYDDKGELKRPIDYKTWVFVGSNLGLQYRKDTPEVKPREQDEYKKTKLGDFHNVYIRPESYQHFLKTGEFPDKTVMVMDVYKAKER